MNNRHVKYTSNAKEVQRYVLEMAGKEIIKRILKCLVIAGVVAIIVIGTIVLL